jgi:hypothetical protein
VFDAALPLVLLGVWIYAIFEVISSDASQVRNLSKMVWLLIVVLLSVVGALAWFFLGRPHGDAPVARLPRSAGPLRRAARREPDEDDPATLQARIEARDRMLEQWAEEERRRASGGDPPKTD